MTTTVHQRVRAFWEDAGVGVRPGVSEAELAAFEERHQLTVPPSVASFYRTCNGNAASDQELFDAWPLAKVGALCDVVAAYRGIPDYGGICDSLPDAASYFAFGDCMLWSQVVAVRLRPADCATQVVWLCGSSWAVVALTFEAFWQQYLIDPVPVLWASEADVHAGR